MSDLASNKVLDIEGHQGHTGDSIRLYSKVAGRASQLWYVDESGFIRSTVNDLAIDVGAYTRKVLLLIHLQVGQSSS